MVSLALFLTALLAHTVANPDIWYHLALAQKILTAKNFYPQETVIAAPLNFVNFYWFFQIFSLFSMKIGGLFGLTFLFWSLWITIFWFWGKVIGFDSRRLGSLMLALLAVVVCQIRFQERPEVFSYLFLVLDMYFLVKWSKPYSLRKILWPLASIQVLWCNSHGYFIFGPVLLGLRALEVYLGERKLKRLLRHSFGVLFLIALCLVSPFGWKTWGAFFDQWRYVNVAAPWISEMRPTTSFGFSQWPLIVFWIYWIFTAIILLSKMPELKNKFFSCSVAALGLFLSILAARNIPFLVLLSAPLLTETKFSLKSKLMAPLFTALVLGLTFWTVTNGYFKSTEQPYKFGIGVSHLILPVKLENDLKVKEIPPNTKWFSDGTIGSYLEYYHPYVHFYGDSRYMSAASVEYFQAMSSPVIFDEINRREHFDVAAFDVARSPDVIESLLRDPRWKLAYHNLTTVVFENLEGSQKNIFTDPLAPIFQGEDLSELANGNAAIQWALIFAQANQGARLNQFLSELQGAQVVPSPVLEVSLASLKTHPDGGLLEKIFSLRPKMLALTPGAGATVDQELAAIKTGAFWTSP